MTAMPKQEKIIIRTPFPTEEEIIATSGLSAKRRAELDAMLENIFREIDEEKRRKRRRARIASGKKK